ncbi:mitochondrial antiviral-signaling protein isoform X1 [Hippoglossus hippoglossus]|uniref:mitochondrial antiviral-signaling protein isoform X1 n=1 Tax=Hippoglossus hippoglossus TaxID=8267 RepID=UPI00148D5638|nr:mitochondrial antiviral-signaling protein isoform X1 [Hippoglossus hippoglossus]XP_034431971.1 mitochondrial antiviral-signaling protein isoform X1 [Hippoglossus hippoglossus]
MSFASDKLYNGYLRRRMPAIVSKVKVREVIIHLPCLTTHDRENIEAKRETNGNYDGMVLLLDCLKRRENWPEQFIEALEACEQTTIAAEIRAEYDALRGNSNPSSPSSTVIRAHVHPAPSASHLPIPESGAAAASPPAEASAPPEPAAQASPPLETPVQSEAQSSAAEQASLPEAVPPPEPVPEPPQATQIEVVPPPTTPPPSPVTPHTPASTPPRQVNAHQEPEENSESDIQDISNGDCVIPDQLSAREGEVAVDSEVTPPPCELDAQVQPDPLQTTATTEVASTPPEEVNAYQEPEENSESDIQDISGDNVVIPDQVSEEKSEVLVNSVVTPCETDTDPDPLRTTAASEVSPPQSPTQANSDVTDGSSFPILTPVKHPVQDTTPPEDKIPAEFLEPKETSEPPITQVVESSPQTETAPTASPLPSADGMDASSFYDDALCMSKPDPLISFQPEDNNSPTLPAFNPPEEPYSGESERLEISGAAPDDVTVSACSAITSITTVSGLPCQENGIAFNHDELGENHYESPCQSLENQEVQVNVVHVSEEPSILNLDGQIPAPQAHLINGEAAREITPSPPSTTTDENPTSDKSYLPPEPAEITPEPKTLPGSEEESAPRTLPSNRKYILTAAGVGACALLMAWKFKN